MASSAASASTSSESPSSSGSQGKNEEKMMIKIHDEEGQAQEHHEVEHVLKMSFDQALAEVRRLAALQDPEKTPYKSKYRGREILISLRDQLNVKDKETPGNEDFQERLGRVQHLLGVNYVETGEPALGEKELSGCVDTLSKKPTHYAVELIDAWNQLGMLWSNRNSYDKAIQLLVSAEDTYNKCQQLKMSSQPLPPVLGDRTRAELLEQKHTITLFFLAQVYSHVKNLELSAKYCHLTLNRQLITFQQNPDANPLPQDWIQNCIGLSVGFLGQKKFRQALYVLDVAEAVQKQQLQVRIQEQVLQMQQMQKQLQEESSSSSSAAGSSAAASAPASGGFSISLTAASPPPQAAPVPVVGGPPTAGVVRRASSQPLLQLTEREKESRANVNRARGHVYLEYFKLSEKAFREKKPDTESKTADDELVTFSNVNVDLPPLCPLFKTVQDARAIFSKGFSAFNTAIEHYALDGFVTEHIEILQEMSQLYKLSATYETDDQKKYKLLKKRAGRLESVVEELSQQHYLAFYQQLNDELARIYGELVDLRLSFIEPKTAASMAKKGPKIIEFIQKAIHYYENWLHTFDDKTTNKEPDSLDPQLHKPYLNSLLAIARLQSKMYSPEPPTMCSFLNTSLQTYTKVIATAQKFKATGFDEELSICKEMTVLLPVKINKINTTQQSFLD